MQRRPDSWTKELLPLLEDEPFRTASQLGLLCSTDYKQVWDCLQQKFALKGNKPDLQFQLQNHNHRPSEPLVEFPIELQMLADKAYPIWTAEQHQEVVRNQFIQGVKFQVVTDPAGEAISDTQWSNFSAFRTHNIWQNKLLISKMLNLYFITMYCSSLSVFIMINMPSGAKSTKAESHSETKMFYFISPSCSDWLVQIVCMIVFAQTATFYTEQCTSP